MKKKILFFLSFLIMISFYGIHYKARASTNGPLIWVDAPVQGERINKDFNVQGWAVNASGLKEVDIFIDGKIINKATIGISRPDVGSIYNTYLNSEKSGFEYLIPINSIGQGRHTLVAESVGNDGSTNSFKMNIFIDKPEPMTWIDEPYNGQSFNSDIKIDGWTLNASGVKEVNVLIDGQKTGNAIYGIARHDVAQVFPQYAGGDKSGYEYNISFNNITAGVHSITIQAVGNDGSIKEKSTSINVVKAPSRMWIDTPTGGNLPNRNFNISGWALNPSGIRTVNIILDGVNVGQAAYGTNRTDVDVAFPGYINGSKSGFQYDVDVACVRAGQHNIVAEAIGNDGSIQNMCTNIFIQKPSPKLWIDAPISGEIIANDIDVQGWALSPSGIRTVSIFLDGQLSGQTNNYLPRADVNSAFPGYKNGANSGFSYKLPLTTIAPGKHNILVRSVASDGSTVEMNKLIEVIKLQAKSCIDTPVNNSRANEDVSIEGWSLNPSGIRGVDVYIDNKFIGQATTGIERLDVNNVYPGYINGAKSGFSFLLDINQLKAGLHTILIHSVGNDGTASDSISRFYTGYRIAVDFGHNVVYDTGASGTRFEDDLTREVGQKVIDKIIGSGNMAIKATPSTATSLVDSLQQRCDVANNNNVDRFVSIHFNKFNGTVNGTEVYYYSDSAKPMAQNVLNNMVALGYTDRGVKWNDYYVLRNTNMPAILVECSFLDNKADMDRYNSDNISDAIVKALLQ